MAVNQITGGNFVFPDGSINVNGEVHFKLTRDATVVGSTPLGRNSVIIFPLDNTGNISGTHSLWPNDQMSPSGIQYIVKVYSAQRELISDPFLLTVTTAPSPFVLA